MLSPRANSARSEPRKKSSPAACCDRKSSMSLKGESLPLEPQFEPVLHLFDLVFPHLARLVIQSQRGGEHGGTVFVLEHQFEHVFLRLGPVCANPVEPVGNSILSLLAQQDGERAVLL